ncbi:MAG: aminotransferase class V-fold PLP-dependent enzyme [Planctomycetota bacterium]|nr:aminotransferase class V-fold PLP-dependent enzyme [Planctomycetota bacterium]
MYFNNAATTWPKPEIVYETVDECFRNLNSPDRTHSAEGVQSSATMQTCRSEVADFFGIKNETRLVFLPSCTYALNLAILGQQWNPGDVIIMSGLEHHAVSRPIRKLARERGINFKVSPYSQNQPLDVDWIEAELKTGSVKLVACTMAANVTGDIMPSQKLGEICRQHGTRYLVDAAQSAGILPVNVQELNADFLTFAGHKGLFGPPGIGGLFVRDGIELETLAEGGTGKDSGKHDMSGSFPSNFEVGTHNLLAITGLCAGVRWVKQAGLDSIREHEHSLLTRFIEKIEGIPGIRLYGNDNLQQRTSVCSFVMKGISPQKIATWLSEQHGVSTRAGYHCAPLAHETIGTLPGEGTVRFGFGFSNTVDEVDQVAGMLAEVPRGALV